MKKTITYNSAVKKVSYRLDLFTDIFSASILLAEMFNVKKEIALDDILHERKKLL